ncbi:prenyltransferase/squalene oxidase repeat-containing protein [Catellatospora sichuanensis]|uniref:prenyltransferase/squalene oxidase repeat-containing protein n=1 Tax=Catellatospora sichuanensis TaxID=1969805 RepID=UPI001FE5C687|nr:prenyltransferase/squalene oxidase repeat-containing protein [Catellatospora sichuanensis]
MTGHVPSMTVVDLDAAIGFVVKKGDPVDRARLSYLRTGASPAEEILAAAEAGQADGGGWFATQRGKIPSVDVTCFRLAQLDDLGALGRPGVKRAFDWLAGRQAADGSWQEAKELAADAPEWAQPGDPEATLYLTANATFWLTVMGLDVRSSLPYGDPTPIPYADAALRGAEFIKSSLNSDGTWPSYLVTGWLGAAVMYRQDMFYEAARMQAVLGERLPAMAPADAAAMAAALRRVGVSADDWTMIAAKRRLAETQRTDGGWESEDGEVFDVHLTLNVIRALYEITPPGRSTLL